LQVVGSRAKLAPLAGGELVHVNWKGRNAGEYSGKRVVATLAPKSGSIRRLLGLVPI
jgi:hypothetical protein